MDIPETAAKQKAMEKATNNLQDMMGFKRIANGQWLSQIFVGVLTATG
jgi:F0F1-type ATP synthase gamma subunit